MASDLSDLYRLIKRFEGCRLRAYLCPAGVWTCGWGSTGTDVGPATVWTQAKADQRMEQDAITFARRTLALCPILVDDARRLSAIADFAYNAGLGNLRGSTLRKRVNAGEWPAAVVQLRKWVRGGGRVLKGLVIRREAEAALLQ